MAPPTPGCFWRLLTEDTMIDGHLIPRGCEVGVCQYALHRSDEYFQHPDRFVPERFRPCKKPRLPSGAFVPFSLGPRSCPARKFAERLISVSLARIIRLAEFRPDQGLSVTPDAEKAERPDYPLKDAFVSNNTGPFLQFRLREGAVSPYASK